MSIKNWKNLSIMIWIILFIFMGLTYYVNHLLPHGNSYPTGDIVCTQDDRGHCVDEYKEDLSKLNIPGWAKFIREYFVIVFVGLVIVGIYSSVEAKIIKT